MSKNYIDCQKIKKSEFRTSDGLCLSYQYCDSRKKTNYNSWECGCSNNNCKPDIVLIHGIGYDSDYWACFFKKFCSVANVFAIDLPTIITSQSLTLNNLSQYVIELLNHLDLDKVYLVGHGLGGLIALNIAALHSSRVVKVAVSSVSPLYYPLPGSDWIYYISLQLQQFLAQYIALDSKSADVRTIANILTDIIDPVDCDSKDLLINQYINALKQYQLYIPVLQQINFIPLVSQITVPVLIMSGTKDPFVPFGATLYLREHIANSAIVEFYGQGSNFPILDTGIYNETVFYFFFVKCDPCCEYLENIHCHKINDCHKTNDCHKINDCRCNNKSKCQCENQNEYNYQQRITIPCTYYKK